MATGPGWPNHCYTATATVLTIVNLAMAPVFDVFDLKTLEDCIQYVIDSFAWLAKQGDPLR